MNPSIISPVEKIDAVFILIMAVCAVILVCIVILMVFFTLRYRKEKSPEPAEITGNPLIEIIWTIIPVIIVTVFFYYGWVSYIYLRNVPENALTVNVTGRMFSWSFRYANNVESPALIVPAGRAVRLSITSVDVVHSIFIPAFRIKKDAVPGMETFAWFLPEKVNIHEIFCAEYCGAKHYSMRADLIAVPVDRFDKWYNGELSTDDILDEVYAKVWAGLHPGLIVMKKNGCIRCHSITGEKDVGPTFKGLLGRKEEVIRGGAYMQITADADYMRKSILDPKADIVKGYSAIMPSYEMSEKDFSRVMEYLETLKDK